MADHLAWTIWPVDDDWQIDTTTVGDDFTDNYRFVDLACGLCFELALYGVEGFFITSKYEDARGVLIQPVNHQNLAVALF